MKVRLGMKLFGSPSPLCIRLDIWITTCRHIYFLSCVCGCAGLGHMAVKFGKALGLKVVVLSTSPNKKTDAIDILKADKFVVTKDEEQFKVSRDKVKYCKWNWF